MVEILQYVSYQFSISLQLSIEMRNYADLTLFQVILR